MKYDRLQYLGEALRALRQRRDQTGRDVADALGVGRTMVSRWETGETPTLTRLLAYADHFDLHLGDLDDLIADVADRPRRPRPVPPPRTPGEVELLLDSMLGPAGPQDYADPVHVARETLRAALLLAGRVVVRRDGDRGR